MKMNYLELTGVCKKAIENNLCNGCSKLEDIHFIGQAKCEYVIDPREKIRKMLGVQERLKYEI